MFLGTAVDAWKESHNVGSPTWLFCTPIGSRTRGRLYFWVYLFYISKARRAEPLGPAHCGTRRRLGPTSLQFYELIDTFLNILKGKPLTILHVVHHAGALIIPWTVRRTVGPSL